MPDIALVKIRETILADNGKAAEMIRTELFREKVFMMNLMSSPGAGKTSLITASLPNLQKRYRICVIEGDIDSMVDSEKIVRSGGRAVQIQTGGDCHLDAPMIRAALDLTDLKELDALLVENIGNLVCPAEFDIGADLNVMILSVPEGDDKILKYPLMFTVCDALIVSKVDCLALFDFDFTALRNRLAVVNPRMKLFVVSVKTGEGIAEWCDWLSSRIDDFQTRSGQAGTGRANPDPIGQAESGQTEMR